MSFGFAPTRREREVCRRLIMPGRRLPTTAAVGRARDSCRLWHEEQESRTGSVEASGGSARRAVVERGGGAHRAAARRPQTRSSCFSLLPLTPYQIFAAREGCRRARHSPFVFYLSDDCNHNSLRVRLWECVYGNNNNKRHQNRC